MRIATVIVLHVGINNFEFKEVTDICTQFSEVVSVARNSFPEAKILVSQVTPRRDELDLKAKEINNYLLTDDFLKKLPDLQVSVIWHDNLDAMNVCTTTNASRKIGVRHFAGNIKNAF